MSRACFWLAATSSLAWLGSVFTFCTDVGPWGLPNLPCVILLALSFVTWFSSVLAGAAAVTRCRWPYPGWLVVGLVVDVLWVPLLRYTLVEMFCWCNHLEEVLPWG